MRDDSHPRPDPAPEELERAWRRPQGPWSTETWRRTTYRGLRFNWRMTVVIAAIWFMLLAGLTAHAFFEGRTRDGFGGLLISACGVGVLGFIWIVSRLVLAMTRRLHGPDPDAP
jgi:hypothetical protein